MAANNSYEMILGKWLTIVKPKKILEYGPGHSTDLMKRICPNSEILSIENEMQYYKNSVKMESELVHIVLAKAPVDDRNSPTWDNYINQNGMFDLIFIDGRERVRCLKWAKNHINPNGVVILHDAERPEYAEGLEGYDKLETWSGTMVLRCK